MWFIRRPIILKKMHDVDLKCTSIEASCPTINIDTVPLAPLKNHINFWCPQENLPLRKKWIYKIHAQHLHHWPSITNGNILPTM